MQILFFNGVHADYHHVTPIRRTRSTARRSQRILRLLFYLGQDIANSPTRPAWKPASYKEIVEGEG